MYLLLVLVLLNNYKTITNYQAHTVSGSFRLLIDVAIHEGVVNGLRIEGI